MICPLLSREEPFECPYSDEFYLDAEHSCENCCHLKHARERKESEVN